MAGWSSRDVFVPLTIVWALSAVVNRTKEKKNFNNNNNKKDKGIVDGNNEVLDSLLVTEEGIVKVLLSLAGLILLRNVVDIWLF